MTPTVSRLLTPALYGGATALGLLAFLYPLWRLDGIPAQPTIVLTAVVVVSLAALLFEAGATGLGPRAVAVLGLLVGVNSLLRFIEVAIPGPGGFTPIFALIILAGYAYGAGFGFLLGAMTLLVSAIATGGVGPWLPYQMIAAGWVGLTAGWLPRRGGRRTVVAGLAIFGAAWGFLYGALLNLWLFARMDVGGAAEGVLARFGVFYVTTSLAWDAFGAAGTAGLLLAAGGPVLRALDRFGLRFRFDSPTAEVAHPAPSSAADDEAADRHWSAALPDGNEPDPPPPPEPAIARWAWVVWAAGAVAAATMIRNPAVLATAWASAEAVRTALPTPRDGPSLPVRFLAFLTITLSTVYSLLMVHTGPTVLFRLPAAWPLIGGVATREGALLGLTNGLALALLITVFGALGRALSTRDWVRLVPSAYESLALVGAIALTFVPSARRELDAIAEAQRLRGRAPRGIAGWVPLGLPLLVGGLERSMSLAESLASRGLGAPRPGAARARFGLAACLVLVASGWLGPAVGAVPKGVGLAVVFAGALVGVGGLALARGVRPTSYRPDPRRPTDFVVAAGGTALVVCAVAVPPWRSAALFDPFAGLAWPLLPPGLALAAAALALPLVILAVRLRHPEPVSPPRAQLGPPARRLTEFVPPTRAAVHLVELNDFSYTYPGAAAPTLDHVSEVLGEGLTLLRGPSGAGKSTLLRALAGLVPHFTGGSASGRIQVAGMDPLAQGVALTGERVALVGGDPEATFVMDVVADEVAYALERIGVPAPELRRAVARALAATGLAGFEERSVATLSGGERQRLAISTALARNPTVLLLDEPTSQLDDETADGVLNAIAGLTAGRPRAFGTIVAEHRLARIRPRANAEVFLPGRPASPTTGEESVKRGGREGLAPDTVVDGKLGVSPDEAPADRGRVLLSVCDVAVAFDGRPVLQSASMELRAGELVALTGSSGAGKTTLLRVCVGLLPTEGGTAELLGKPVRGRELADVARDVALLPQDPSRLLFAETVLDELRWSQRAFGRPVDDEAAYALLAHLDVDHLAERYPRDLSTGERQRVALAALLVNEPPVWLLDEPTRGLDDAAIAALGALLRSRAAEGGAVLVATHDARLVEWADRVVHLSSGAIEPGRFGAKVL